MSLDGFKKPLFSFDQPTVMRRESAREDDSSLPPRDRLFVDPTNGLAPWSFPPPLLGSASPPWDGGKLSSTGSEGEIRWHSFLLLFFYSPFYLGLIQFCGTGFDLNSPSFWRASGLCWWIIKWQHFRDFWDMWIVVFDLRLLVAKLVSRSCWAAIGGDPSKLRLVYRGYDKPKGN